MADSREERAAEIQDSIRQILYHEWDPIGVAGFGPDDEYDSYIAPVYRILAGSRSEQELVELLSGSSEEILGGSAQPGPSESSRAIAQRLLELDVKL